MNVVQWIVSYAPGGRSIRDVNAKTKVTIRGKIYRIPEGKVETIAKYRLSIQAAKRIPKNV